MGALLMKNYWAYFLEHSLPISLSLATMMTMRSADTQPAFGSNPEFLGTHRRFNHPVWIVMPDIKPDHVPLDVGDEQVCRAPNTHPMAAAYHLPAS
ncbi:hypothetical protein K227x_53470 [Rubripirellula lacrimiformis]|uniref:Uncharacterized protein n=1 Tax=Rubripirellula lacrimiformis TaxID=1930273 RepID=A0A517NIP5_9BACT|nr:hypothetical protein K227x_53470 [Rubripirellula lacrimiformis]